MAEQPHRDALAQIPGDQGAHSVYERSYNWLLTLKCGSGFRSAEGKEQSLIATCCGILMLEGLGKLQSISEEERVAWGSYLQGCQDADSGLFADPLDRFPAETTHDDSSYLAHQMTYFSLQAMDALGMKAPYRLRFMDEFSSAEVIAAWLERLDWSKAWLQSDKAMFVLTFLIYRVEVEQDRSAATLFHSVLDWFERTKDAKTGLWGIQQGASWLDAGAAGYHIVPFYEYVHRPIMGAARMIDFILRPPPDTILADLIRGGACESLAAIDLLTTFTRKFSYRKDEIKQVLIQSYWAVRNMPHKDGGFSYAQGETADIHGFDNWATMGVDPDNSSVWATWLRLLTLATIERRYADDLPQVGEWQFHRWPALGYHRTADKLSEHEREVLPLWIQQTSYPASLARQPTSEPPTISVIIPCYNLGRYLHEAVESVLAQTMQEFEVIIVNDGSTDEFTRLLLANFDRPKTRVIEQANQGLPAARNHGIRHARGRYICCLDADDRLRPKFFEKAVAILDSQPDAGFVTGHLQTFDEKDELVRYDTCAFPELLIDNQAIVPALFRKDAWERVGGYCETFSISGIEDWDFWISILESAYRAVVLPEVLYEYRIRPDAMSVTMTRPEIWGQLSRELAVRHQRTYSNYMVEVIAKLASRWAEIREWADERGRAITWWERQSDNWRRLAEQREQIIREQSSWVGELERGKAWLEEQSANWQRLAEQRESWIGELERGKAWLEEQSASWQRLAEEQVRIGEVEQTEAPWEGSAQDKSEKRIND